MAVDSFDELLDHLEHLVLESMLYMQHMGDRILFLHDAELDEECNLKVHFSLDVQWRDAEKWLQHEVVTGDMLINYSKGTVEFMNYTRRPFSFNDNYYRTVEICKTAETIATRIMDRPKIER
jgi:hypothetical protein